MPTKGDVAARVGFDHEAYFYAGEAEFLAGTVPFIEAGLAADEAVLVVVDRHKIGSLRHALGADGRDVQFADMADLGRNPARIIPAWQDFVDTHAGAGRGLRGIGEPIWPGRSPAELRECHLHEALLNVAFEDGPAWLLLCPYDVGSLDAHVVERARVTHPVVADPGARRPSRDYADPRANPFDDDLRSPPADADRFEFGSAPGSFYEVRRFVAAAAAAVGMDARRAEDFVLAVDEVATNSVRHGCGGGTLRMWPDGSTLICDVADRGVTRWDPLVGRTRPSPEQIGGRGLWLANQVCDLVQISSGRHGTAVRLHLGFG